MKQLVLDIGPGLAPSLDSFFVGSNRAAVEHLCLWLTPGGVAKPQVALPSYLWGAHGCGKSHLLRSVQAALTARGESVAWLDATAALAPEFDPRWSAVMLDDVDAFDTTRQQVAFNWLINAQTQACPVLAAGALPPADLALRDDLRTRLGWGHVFALHLPDEVQCRTILRCSAEARGLILGDEVVDFMLTRFSRDLSSLMALLNLMDRYALQTKRSITVPLIKSMMDNSEP